MLSVHNKICLGDKVPMNTNNKLFFVEKLRKLSLNTALPYLVLRCFIMFFYNAITCIT